MAVYVNNLISSDTPFWNGSSIKEIDCIIMLFLAYRLSATWLTSYTG